MSQQVSLPDTKPWWQRFTKHHRFEHFYRLAVSIVALNLVWFLLQPEHSRQWLADALFYNLTLAILIRQQYVVNLLFKLATFSKTSLPLAIRWRLGKVYHFGGIHVGAALSGSAFFALYCWVMARDFFAGQLSVLEFALVAGATAALASMIIFALPAMRAKHHNLFERTHRFLGWSVLAIFIALQVITVKQSALPWYQHSQVWLTAVILFSVVLPWLRLRKVPVEIAKPSKHAVIAKFDYGMTSFPGSSMAISLNPLTEWHSFATIPSPNQSGYRLAISRAGDWTGRFIDNPPSHVWVKGIATCGVANIEVLFKRVVYIATGSGIGPVLPHLLAKQVPTHLVWATRSPRQTYGDALVDEILAAEPKALIHNTDERGKPDMVQLAFDAYQRFDAEAVIVISNQKLTRQVVYGLESRGIPCFGAIWDS